LKKKLKMMQVNFKALSGKRFMSMQIIYPISKRSKIGYAQIKMLKKYISLMRNINKLVILVT
jgi:hypothetical protein